MSTLSDGDIFEANALGMQTMVGVGNEARPADSGNCFSVVERSFTVEELTSGAVVEYRIVNFNVENLNALIKLGLSWPLKCKLLKWNKAIVHDERIGERWYSKRYCEVCCPTDLLPINQRQAQEREIMRGDRTEKEKFTSFRLGTTAQFK